ncbi:thioesterase II family protein [Umezawaea tangerina]|uniref:Surfactin synthase thioesterase subunit n=1 Tax=Umezawaea tangerina TaxID=84725 RepID=A0A2T0TGJ6_9PSEU|nr:alpha/beta fold hydrolase [Umezawaea tangerina]PRY44822.1 surfactin synthase thioesterase subunit [Umezawaea tangerina]
MTDDQRKWVRRYRSAPDAAVRLVCLPHAGGGASYYRPMAMALSPAVEVLAVQYPGRQDRAGEPFVADFAELVERTFAAVLPALGRPVALFGHSMGSLVAFEVAKRMEAEGIAPRVLFASSKRPPGQADPELPHTATDRELIADIAALNGTEERLLDNADIRELFLPVLRADLKALEGYRPDGRPVACPVVALTGDDDDRVPVADAAGWERHTTGRFDLEVFPGGHFYLTGQWDGVGSVITEHLRAAVPTG